MSRALAALTIVAFAYWALHASGDWLWAFPAVTAPAIAWLGMAARLESAPDRKARSSDSRLDSDRPEAGGLRRAGPAALGAAAAVVVILAAGSYLLPWAAARDVQIAANTWGANPDAAFERLERAQRLNPFSARADLVAGTIAARLGDRERMREAFTSALERDPKSWYAQLELGTLDALEGRASVANERLAIAAELSPRDPLIAEVQDRLLSGRSVGLGFLERKLLERVCSRVGRTDATPYCA